jgi:cold shock CspA family protein
MEERLIGRVKHYNEEKGWGWIVDKTGKDHFFHASHVRDFRLVDRHDIVSFIISKNNRGPCAGEIKVIEKYNPNTAKDLTEYNVPEEQQPKQERRFFKRVSFR